VSFFDIGPGWAERIPKENRKIPIVESNVFMALSVFDK
jgi:hypothetical protein